MKALGCLRVLFLGVCLAGAPLVQAVPPPPRGLYLLSDRHVPVEKMVLPSFLSGYALRIAWKDLEPTKGEYDFALIKSTVSELQKRKLKMTLEIFASMVPDYVLAGADGTFKVRGGTAPLPWDPQAQARWKALLGALAQLPVWDSVANKEVALRDHPTLTAMDAPVVGLQCIRDIRRDLVSHPAYRRELFLDAVEASVRSSREAFPADYGFTGFFRMEDDNRRPSLDEAVFVRLERTFMGPDQAGLGLFQELWSDDGPNKSTLGAFLARVKAPNVVMLQSLTSWKRPFTSAERVASGNPDKAFATAYKEFGARYFELYSADVRSSDLKPVFEAWAARLNAGGELEKTSASRPLSSK